MQADDINRAPTKSELPRETAVYTSRVLSFYDLTVVHISNTFIWRCPSRRILDLYNEHVTARHLEVGVGTGYFLDKSSFPTSSPAITLLDPNPNCLATASQRIARYAPVTHQADVLKPLSLPRQQFDSIGLNYVLHCLPGPFTHKAQAFTNLVPLLSPGGVIFGTTILSKGVHRRPSARWLMGLNNRRGVFNNTDDGLDELKDALKSNFRTANVRIVGCVAFFVGRA